MSNSWQQNSFASSREEPPAKRARVALACQRCKTRKQKCDGKHPSCSNCGRQSLSCEYVIPSKPMPFGKNHYLASLEKRVSELEEFLATKGLLDKVPPFTIYDQSHSVPEVVNAPKQAQRPDTARTQSQRESFRGEIDARACSPHEEGDSLVRILRDLSLESNGGYIGASSHFTIGRLVGSIVQGQQYSPREEMLDEETILQEGGPTQEMPFSAMPSTVADKLFSGYMKHVATRYPVLQSNWIRELHKRRTSIINSYERSTLHLVYAIAGRFLETTGEIDRDFSPERHHEEVLKDLDEMLRYHDTRSVVTLLLLAVYSLRSKGGPGAWAYIGLAMRIAIDLGLHRQTSSMEKIGFDVEMRKRLFWSCYTMDRQISIPLGRPFSISDRDIDVAFPFDVDENCQDIPTLERAAKLGPSTPRIESTSLTAFLHILRLRRIESSIQQSIYRVDERIEVTDTEIDQYLDQLENWKSMIPLDAKGQYDRDSIAFDGYDYYMVFYYKCHRLLLYPLISQPRVKPKYVKACVEVCGGVAQTYKRLHQTLSVGYSLMALQTVFMAGLTLIYCAWISPQEIFDSSISNDINACSIVLFVITERWPAAKKYRDAFETIKRTVVDPMSTNQAHTPRRVLGTLSSVYMPGGEGRQEYCDMINHMSGQAPIGTSTESRPFSSSIMIGMEQAHYQMGTSHELQDVSVPSDQQGFGNIAFLPADMSNTNLSRNRPGQIDEQYSALSERANGTSSWSYSGLGGEMDFSIGAEPYDWQEFTADMGWIADTSLPQII